MRSRCAFVVCHASFCGAHYKVIRCPRSRAARPRRTQPFRARAPFCYVLMTAFVRRPDGTRSRAHSHAARLSISGRTPFRDGIRLAHHTARSTETTTTENVEHAAGCPQLSCARREQRACMSATPRETPLTCFFSHARLMRFTVTPCSQYRRRGDIKQCCASMRRAREGVVIQHTPARHAWRRGVDFRELYALRLNW